MHCIISRGLKKSRAAVPPGEKAARGRADLLVDGLVDQLVLADPRHHAAKLRADFLDLVAVIDAADTLEARGARTVFLHPVRSELAGLDVLEDTLHLGLRLIRDDARAGDVFAPLGR